MVSSADLATLRIEDFAPHCDGVFEMQTAGGGVPLKLAQVASAGDSGRQGGAFSLMFVAAAATSLPQAIYPVTHPVLGVMEIFLVPIGPLQGGSGYQAIFT
jgi:uncharacterized protein DUF6916